MMDVCNSLHMYILCTSAVDVTAREWMLLDTAESGSKHTDMIDSITFMSSLPHLRSFKICVKKIKIKKLHSLQQKIWS